MLIGFDIEISNMSIFSDPLFTWNTIIAILGGIFGILSFILTILLFYSDLESKPQLECKLNLLQIENTGNSKNYFNAVTDLTINNLGRFSLKLNRVVFFLEYFKDFDNLLDFGEDGQHLIDIIDPHENPISLKKEWNEKEYLIEKEDWEWLTQQNFLFIMNLPRFTKDVQKIRYNEKLKNQILNKLEDQGLYRATLLVQWGKKGEFITFQSDLIEKL